MNSPHYLLDTDTASYLVRGGYPVLTQRVRFIRPSRIYVSVISVAEMLYGVKKYPMLHERRIDLSGFLERVLILEWDMNAAKAYADIRHSLVRSGQPIGDMDMMIAAHALAADLTLVSNNTRHYERLAPPLRLENWTEA